MDASVETRLLEANSDARHARNEPSESSNPQSTPERRSPNRSLSKRKSLRARPTDLLEQQHAIPPLPLRSHASQPELRSRPSSKMSLFSLFSKPKVEKLRGYAESGLDAPPRALSHSFAPSPRKGSIRELEPLQGQTRPTTSRTSSTRTFRSSTKESPPPPPPVPQIPVDHRTFEPLPWFQAIPQAIRHGTFEASMIAPDVVLQKNRQRMAGISISDESPQEDVAFARASGDSKAAARAAFRSGSVAMRSEDLPKKAFVLVTSGYLLQYTETGASDRMPEKVLKLGSNSAAFASDLIPGRHHVLQVSHAVDAKGALVNDRQSIFSKFSLRSQAPRRMVSNFLIVMPGAQELGQWLSALRQEIQQQGGKLARSDSPTEQRPGTGEPPKLDLRKTPSQSHRYQVKRDPSKVLSVISPLGDSFSWFPSPLESPAEEPLEKSLEKPLEKAVVVEDAPPPAKDDTESVHSRPRAPSDSPSVTSSTGQSVEQQQLETLRDSTRISHTSTAATTSTYPSRNNSITSTPPTDQVRDAVDGDSKSPYRSLSSYSQTKRRSAVPIALKLVPALSSPENLLQQRRRNAGDTLIESPKMMSPVSELAPPGQRLSAVSSVPNMHVKVDRHDSKVASPCSSSRERPESFLAELPDTASWTSKTSPSYKRTSFAQYDSPIRERPATAHGRPNSRTPSQSFSLPLRINTTDTAAKRISSLASEDGDVLSPIPAVHTLSAKVDFTERKTIDTTYIPTRSSSAEPRRASARLSLFPTADTSSLQHRPQSAAAAANGTLRRPTSLQVRNPDQAAFLSSSRTYPNPRTASQQRSVTTVPIRRLKPSRSLQTFPSEPPSRNFSRQSSLSSTNEEEVRATPLPATAAAAGRRPSLPAGYLSRYSRNSSMLPAAGGGGDFLMSLGPPSAPPPKAPLPELPPPGARSRSKSPMVVSRYVGVAIGEGRRAESRCSTLQSVGEA